MKETVFERPRWARRERACDLTGVPEGKLVELVASGFVRARKMEAESPKSACVFCVPDIEEWLENDAAPARFAARGDNPAKAGQTLGGAGLALGGAWQATGGAGLATGGAGQALGGAGLATGGAGQALAGAGQARSEEAVCR